MTLVQVTFPVLKGSRRFIIEKGRRWSVIEHLLLDALSRRASSAAELSEKSKLPRRVVVEAFVRLMRAGWVEVVATTKETLFQITTSGAARAHQDQLPSATITEPGWRSFAIEQLTGCVFRGRELDLLLKNQLPIHTDEQPVLHLSASPVNSLEDMSEVFTAIEGEDELIVGVDRGSEKLVERYALVTVKESQIDGLPTRAPPALSHLILGAVSQNRRKASSVALRPPKTVSATTTTNKDAPSFIEATYDPADLIVDSEEHVKSFERIINSASDRILIHSTFISDERSRVILPMLLKAAERGAKIDILWGQDDMGSSTNSSQFAAAKMQAAVDEAGKSGSITVHPFSTNSHAKVIIADSAKGWSALIGSCNWLASDFSSFETSFRLREPLIVGQLIRKLSGLAQGRPGVWNKFSVDLAVLGRRVMDLPAPGGRKVPMRLIYGSQHAKVVLDARDAARKRIFSLSHRIGIVAESMTLLPTLAAVKARGIDASFYYGRTTGPLSGGASLELIRTFKAAGFEIKPIHRPRIHAKVLGPVDI